MISTLQALKNYLWGWNFGLFCCMTTSFRDIKLPENRKCSDRWPQIEHLTVKSTLYTLNTHPWGPDFGQFRCTIRHFRGTTGKRSAKIGNAPNDPKLNLKHLTVKTTLSTLNWYYPLRPCCPNFGPFRPTTSGKNRENQKCKILKKKKKNGGDILWKGTFPPNLALICLTGSAKTGFTDGRTGGQRTPAWRQ